MTNLQKRIAGAIAAGALLLNTTLPVLAQVAIEISGNGSGSDNDAKTTVVNTTTVVQSNFASINNDVDAEAETGDNEANDNTGGSVSIDTGNASTGVGISNSVNSNSAEVDCCVPGADVLISGNGSDSDNTVDLTLVSTTGVFQDNVAKLDNKVKAEAETGDNEANDNTGGDVEIDTGDASVGVLIENSANSNSARISGDPGDVSLRIIGNGSGSDNDIDLDLIKTLTLTQDNFASLRNKVDAEAETGENKANDNTGGSVEIDTGDADVEVGIDNMVNFNWADVECGCVLDVLAKIHGNGSDSDNTIKATLVDTRLVFQDNVWVCDKKHFPRWGQEGEEGDLEGGWWGKKKGECNDVKAEAETGENKANDNTGPVDGVDPSIDTGNAETDVLIENAGNVNVVGDGPDLELPDLPDFPEFPGLEFGFNLSFLWLWLMGGLG